MAKAPSKSAKKAATPEIDVGSEVKFLGYGPDVPEDEQFLEAGETYVVSALPEIVKDDDNNDVQTGYAVQVANPDFNPKKKPNDNTNPEFLEVEVMPEEIELIPAEPEVKEAPAKAGKGKGKAAAAAEAPAKGKGKGAAKKAAPAKKDAAEKEAEDDMPDLEGEDESVLALVEESDDLIATAQELEANVATTEYQLGGVLYHIKKSKEHLKVDGGEVYGEPGGFKKFLMDYFNLDYRKAMYLIEIYTCFTIAGIEAPSQIVAEIGWTKASKIAKHLVGENADVEGLIELARENTVQDLSTSITEQVEVGGSRTAGEKVKRVSLNFRLFEEQAGIVDDALKAAVEQLGLKDINEALVHIVQEWVVLNGGEAAQQGEKPAGKAAKKAAPGKPAAKAAKKATAKA